MGDDIRRRLVVVVDCSKPMAISWPTILADYITNLLRLVEDWPSTMLIYRLVPEELFLISYSILYGEDSLIHNTFFITLKGQRHKVLEKLQKNIYFAVIPLPSQMILIRPSEEANDKMVGILFPRDVSQEDLSGSLRSFCGNEATQQLAEEEKLHKQQNETLKTNYKKYELIDNAQANGTIKKLDEHYNNKK